MKRKYEISLNDRCGGALVVDLYGYITNELGEQGFKLTRVLLSDGRTIDVEGEHDFPYLCDTHSIVDMSIHTEAER